MDRSPAGYMVGPGRLRAKAHGVGAQGARRSRVHLCQPAVGQDTPRIHKPEEGQQLPTWRLWRQRRRCQHPLQTERSRLCRQHGWMRMGTRLLGRNVQLSPAEQLAQPQPLGEIQGCNQQQVQKGSEASRGTATIKTIIGML